ncbi:hypothetical protein OOK13_01550 [Streptomyces sp. NBC_00378]|uniref:hypothetical protein n=1 Tax=unclassified Streptomyces TaxID=2593676 RepID=UPI0022548BFD|nr:MULTISPECIES: hypothetical protein [unclassified Streptomyces]MCX5107240.1 hypothetical protein [Streptomyces sp. NBC_00378]
MMHNAGRRRGMNEDAERIHALFWQAAVRWLPAVKEAMGIQAKALLVRLNAVCRAVDELAKEIDHRSAFLADALTCRLHELLLPPPRRRRRSAPWRIGRSNRAASST